LADRVIEIFEFIVVNGVGDHSVVSVIDVFQGTLKDLGKFSLSIQKSDLLIFLGIKRSLQSYAICSWENDILTRFKNGLIFAITAVYEVLSIKEAGALSCSLKN
jgi:hypothetical protein